MYIWDMKIAKHMFSSNYYSVHATNRCYNKVETTWVAAWEGG